jgi:hypothetical protein
MKRISMLAASISILLLICVMSAQELTKENPFPEKEEQSAVFETGKPIILTGRISKEISRPTSAFSYLFFRMTVSGKSWTVKIHDPKLTNVSQVWCDLCLADEYTPEMSRLKVGTTVTVRGFETKKHDRRLLLSPVSGPNTIAGITLPNGRP